MVLYILVSMESLVSEIRYFFKEEVDIMNINCCVTMKGEAMDLIHWI